MMQNLLLTTFTSLKSKNEINCWENRPFATVWPENNQQNKKDVTKTIKKKQKRVRTAFSTNQLQILENIYSRQKYVNSAKRAEIASTLKISDKSVKIWFQNRRMKEKRESSESSCESSSESVSIESFLGSTPNPSQTIISEPTTEPISHYPESNYQLPTYCNTNELQSTYEGMTPSGSATYFQNECSVYPTQYYPNDLSFLNGESHGYDQYATEGNNYWTESQYPYYSTV